VWPTALGTGGIYTMRTHQRRTARPSRFRPTLTCLDDRWLPSTLTVTTLADSGAGSLRGQIAAAASGDTIVFDSSLTDGTVSLTSGELLINKNLTITGLGADHLAVSRSTSAAAFRIFEIAAGNTVSISGLTISNGMIAEDSTSVIVAAYGGGIYNKLGASLSLSNSIVSQNIARGMSTPDYTGSGWGGGIFSEGTVTVSGTTIADNQATDEATYTDIKSAAFGYGAGIYNAGTLTVTDDIVTGNTIGNTTLRPISNWGNGYGGGIWSSNTLTISGSLIIGNSAWGSGGPSLAGNGYGGGLDVSGTTSITTSAVDGNLAGGGGGLYADASDFGPRPQAYGGGIDNSGTLTVTRSTLAEDNADGRLAFGGGLYDTGTATLTNVTLSGDNANGMTIVPSNSGGGAIAVIGGSSVTLSFCTVSNNAANGMVSLPGGIFIGAKGGGVYVASPTTLTTDDTIFAGNQAVDYDDEGTPSPAAGPDVFGTVNSLGHNLVGKTDDSTGWVLSDLTGTYAAPLDPKLGPLQDNGGPRVGSTLALNDPHVDPPLVARTHEVLWDSPAMQAGDSTRSPVTDERGVARDTAQPNIGAYEASMAGFRVTAPATTSPGAAFDLTVTAIDPYGKTVYIYVGTITFGSSDTSAILPANYTFQQSDHGVHTFTSGATLYTLGLQTITVWDVTNSSFTGSTTVDVVDGGGGGGGPGGGGPGGG
jgi:hypothetical protein